MEDVWPKERHINVQIVDWFEHVRGVAVGTVRSSPMQMCDAFGLPTVESKISRE
jgi:hypothetical protein